MVIGYEKDGEPTVVLNNAEIFNDPDTTFKVGHDCDSCCFKAQFDSVSDCSEPFKVCYEHLGSGKYFSRECDNNELTLYYDEDDDPLFAIAEGCVYDIALCDEGADACGECCFFDVNKCEFTTARLLNRNLEN